MVVYQTSRCNGGRGRFIGLVATGTWLSYPTVLVYLLVFDNKLLVFCIHVGTVQSQDITEGSWEIEDVSIVVTRVIIHENVQRKEVVVEVVVVVVVDRVSSNKLFHLIFNMRIPYLTVTVLEASTV